MAEQIKLNNPLLAAVWPGMGSVAISAGYYLMAKLGMHELAEFGSRGFNDIDQIAVKDGMIQPARWPRSRLFVWQHPNHLRDIVVFIGEAQPPLGKYSFCESLIEFVQKLGVRQVYTFAAMATQMHPEQPSRVFGAAIDEQSLQELKDAELVILEDGNIGGLNGVLLAAAADKGLRGACLLGEMPHIFAQLPFPKASLAVLQVFSQIAEIEIDFTELSQQADSMDEQLGQLLARVETAIAERARSSDEGEESFGSEFEQEPGLAPEDEKLIERLFAEAKQDRSKAYELKRELDRLDVFGEYEDRFLDLFKKSD